MDHTYSIPYLPEEQSRLQFAKNCIDSLSQLELVMDDIFTCITLRITDSSEKVSKLKARAEAAQKKVTQLKGRSNATQVFCSPNFPGRPSYEPFKCLFSETEKKLSSLKKYDDIAIEPLVVNDKMQLPAVIYKEKKLLNKKADNKAGIGKLPVHISSVSSTLLYNTQYDLYQNYQFVDPLLINYDSRIEMKKSLDQKWLEEAPTSITNADNVGFAAKDDFHYLPDLTDLPEFDLPLELPSLPGIANDLLYEGDAGPHIAPSYFLPDFPQELDQVVSSEEIFTNDPVAIADASTNEKQPLASSDIDEQKNIDAIVEKKTIPPPLSGIPPPPPMPAAMMAVIPPPPPLPVIIPSTTKSESSHCVIPPKVSTDSRSNLMKAIQQAGGASKARLRKVGHSDEAEIKEKTMTAPPGDYMSDLFAKLAKRRKGISGGGANKDNESKQDVPKLGTLQQMSALIPPPPKSNDDSDKISEDDWD